MEMTVILPLTRLCNENCRLVGEKSNHMHVFMVIYCLHYCLSPQCFEICMVRVTCGFRVTAPPSGQNPSLDDSTQWYSVRFISVSPPVALTGSQNNSVHLNPVPHK